MSSQHTLNKMNFTEVEIEAFIADVRCMLLEGERVSNFISNLFETARDGVIEWYEFLDFLLVVQTLPRPLERTALVAAMEAARIKGVQRPWSFDSNGVCSMPETLDAAKRVFKRMDTNNDGTLDSLELYAFSE
jgi:hypothetical protein